MKKISEVLNHQIGIMGERGWDTIYVAVDWHDTMMKSTYTNSYGNYDLYPYASEVLQWMTHNGNIRLILYTCSHDDQIRKFTEIMLDKHGIDFEFVNGNPEVQNTKTGNFDDKFYYNVLLDDKAGMNPHEDWLDLKYNIPKAEQLLEHYDEL